MKKIIYLLSLSAFALCLSANVSAKSFHSFHKKFANDCTKCHVLAKGETMVTEATTFKCTTCHGSAEKLAEKSKAKGLTGPRNPHTSIHFGTSMPCEECHKEHKEPQIYCESCHRTMPMSIPGESHKHKTVE